MNKLRIKVKLIQPKMLMRPMDTRLKTRMSPPLGLYTILNLINDQCETTVLNENIEELDFQKEVDLVGISVTVDTLPRAIEISNYYRKKGIPVIAGGIQITCDPQSCLENFDTICVGAAEDTWLNIISDFKIGKLKKIYISSLNKGEQISSPAYHLIDNSKYLYTNIISTSKGCPYLCSFCYNSCEKLKNTYLNRPILDVLKDIKTLSTKHVLFIDDNFIGNPNWTYEFLKELKKINIIWSAAITSNVLDLPNMLDEMKNSGCKSLFIGFESLNSKVIANVKKSQNKVNKYDLLVNELHKRGIMINASFVFGLDNENKDVFKETLEWVIRNKIETITSHILTPYPGTKLYDDLLSANRIIDFNLSNYNTAHVVFRPENMSINELQQGYLNFYKEVYSLKNIMKRLPKNKKLWSSYLLFNIFYRKYGKFTEKICDLVSYNNIGEIVRYFSYGIK